MDWFGYFRCNTPHDYQGIQRTARGGKVMFGKPKKWKEFGKFLEGVAGPVLIVTVVAAVILIQIGWI